MMSDLKGKRVLVTGASRGAGYGIAKAFAAAGAEVIGTARSADKLERLRSEIEVAGGKFSAVPGDLSTRESVRAIARRCGEIDVLINNAAFITGKWESLLDQDDAQWDMEFAVNVVAPITLMKELVPGMMKRGWGRVINISSTAATRPVPVLVAYSASKAALEAASQATAIDFAPHGVRVNVVALGVTDTEALHENPFLAGGLTIEDVGWMATPIGRVNKINEVAALCLFLVSDEADPITGIIIRVDGGQTAGQFNYRQGRKPQ
jgi:NAD(P)-dependent dehydrogenase (short-subunit alcohol dehydrogenase family)